MGPVTALGQDSLERAVRAAGIDATPVWFDETGSTNDEALALAAAGAPDWTVVAAGHQTRGRGRLGRSWTDAPGSALLFSVLLRPDVSPPDAPVLSLAAAVEMIAAVGHPDVRAKWPNDLVIGDRKVGGILVEAVVRDGRLEHVVVGMGVNVFGEPGLPPEVRPTATSLADQGIAVDQATILTRFLGGFPPRVGAPAERIVRDYRGISATLGRGVRVETLTGDDVEGVAADVDEHGALVVRVGGGPDVVVAFGEVTHLR
jgi:BirA family transcriptional regulator, biotin operon repressor / biotin---[acetyl-CoA-carboxylase] ligase